MTSVLAWYFVIGVIYGIVTLPYVAKEVCRGIEINPSLTVSGGLYKRFKKRNLYEEESYLKGNIILLTVAMTLIRMVLYPLVLAIQAWTTVRAWKKKGDHTIL